MNDNEKTRKLLIAHYKRYPLLKIEDIFKYLHQSSFGCEHLIASPYAAANYIQKEAQSLSPSAEHILIEELDGEYCRVHLSYLKKGLRAETLGKLLFLSAQHHPEGVSLLEEKLRVAISLIEDGILPFEKNAFAEALEIWKNDGYPALHHSESFREMYHPAYRVIKSKYASLLPLLTELDQRGETEAVTLEELHSLVPPHSHIL